MKGSVKEQTRRLWELCFGDSEAFVDLYFRLRYTDSVNRFIEREGEVVAALQALPYPMTFCGSVIPMSYISGACTHPARREQGLMRGLLSQTHRAMYGQGDWVSTLIPAEEWLKGYYARSGYAVCFGYGVERKVMNRPEESVDNSSVPMKMVRVDIRKPADDAVYAFFDSQMRRRPCCVQHTLSDWQAVLSDWALAGNELYAFYVGENLRGLAFSWLSEGEVWVKEFLCQDTSEAERMLSMLASSYGADTVNVMRPSGGEWHELGMARILRVEDCLRLYASRYPEETHYIYVADDADIPENNGHYMLRSGHCSRSVEPDTTYRRHTVASLTAWLFARLHPYMSLMMD